MAKKKNFVSTPSNPPSVSSLFYGLGTIAVAVAVIYGVVWIVKK